MTNLEAIRANLSDAHGVVLTENHFVKALADVGLWSYGEYSSQTLINTATLSLFDILIEGASVSEGGLSYSSNLEGLKAAKLSLQGRMGITPATGTISSVKPW